MALPSIFDKETAEKVIARINALTPATQPQWGTMNVAQMLAHCNVTYEMVYTDKHPKPGAFMRFILKSMVKSVVVSEKPYKHNSRTAPQFLMSSEKDFEIEKDRLVNHIRQTQQLGAAHFDGKESHSFGPLKTLEWNNMFYKHLDHHLRQFGV
ncbi:DUF1569 domain-containing protein [Chitinophagaceae bacterium MMS25-I14]